MVVAVAAVRHGDRVGEGRVGRVEAGVEDADDDALTLGALEAAGDVGAVPDGGGADPLGTLVGGELALEVDLDGGDAVDVGDLLGLRAGQPDRDAVERLGVGRSTWAGPPVTREMEARRSACSALSSLR